MTDKTYAFRAPEGLPLQLDTVETVLHIARHLWENEERESATDAIETEAEESKDAGRDEVNYRASCLLDAALGVLNIWHSEMDDVKGEIIEKIHDEIVRPHLLESGIYLFDEEEEEEEEDSDAH